MADLVSIVLVKAHLRVFFNDDDVLIAGMVDAAIISTENYLYRRVYADETAMGDDATGIVINAAIQAAILLQVGHLYIRREATAGQQAHTLPFGYADLLTPYRDLSKGD